MYAINDNSSYQIYSLTTPSIIKIKKIWYISNLWSFSLLVLLLPLAHNLQSQLWSFVILRLMIRWRIGCKQLSISLSCIDEIMRSTRRNKGKCSFLYRKLLPTNIGLASTCTNISNWSIFLWTSSPISSPGLRVHQDYLGVVCGFYFLSKVVILFCKWYYIFNKWNDGITYVTIASPYYFVVLEHILLMTDYYCCGH